MVRTAAESPRGAGLRSGRTGRQFDRTYDASVLRSAATRPKASMSFSSTVRSSFRCRACSRPKGSSLAIRDTSTAFRYPQTYSLTSSVRMRRATRETPTVGQRGTHSTASGPPVDACSPLLTRSRTVSRLLRRDNTTSTHAQRNPTPSGRLRELSVVPPHSTVRHRYAEHADGRPLLRDRTHCRSPR